MDIFEKKETNETFMLTGDNDSVFSLWVDKTIELEEKERTDKNKNTRSMH